MQLASERRLVCILSVLLLSIVLGPALFIQRISISESPKLILYKPGGGIEPSSALENPNTWDTDWAEAIPISDAPDVFLKQLSQYFKWDQLPSHCVQHVCSIGMLHHAERYVLKLSPDQFHDLQKKIDAELTDQQPQAVQAGSWSPMAHVAGDPPWWTPPNQSVFYFEPSRQKMSDAGYHGLMVSCRLEYDAHTRLLYLDVIEC